MFINRQRSVEDLKVENALLLKRRELIESGVDRKELQIKGLKLYKGKEAVNISKQEPETEI